MTTILFVEDEYYTAKPVLLALERAGYKTLWAADKMTVIDVYARHQVDLILIDWMLPQFGGLDILRHLRQITNIPVIVLAAEGEGADPVTALEIGADAYLTKPYALRELVVRIQTLLRRAKQSPQTARAARKEISADMSLGPLHLNLATHEAKLDDVPLALSRTEFELLQFLMHFPERAMSRSDLIEGVWSATYMGGDRSVDNAVLRLRKKLGKLGDVIETVWGIGYRMRSNF